ncbi:MAG: hypothetical protein AAGF54_15650 [Pseudomonadota bacterium]
MGKRSIVVFSTLCMVALAAFMILYPYKVLNELIPFAFTQPDLWENHWLVKYEGEIPFILRFGYFVLWLVPVVATVCMTAIAMHFFYLFRQGVYFDFRIVRDIQLLGICAVISGIGVLSGYSFTNWLISYMNTEDRWHIQFGYDPTEVSLILTGTGLYLGGWIIKSLALQDQENKGFV